MSDRISYSSIIPDAPLEIVLSGHLTRAALDLALDPVASALRAREGVFDLLVDARAMADYDAEARTRFVEWNKAFRPRLSAVAILTDKTLWHMVIVAMSLASGQAMKAFDHRQPAMDWLVTRRSWSPSPRSER